MLRFLFVLFLLVLPAGFAKGNAPQGAQAVQLQGFTWSKQTYNNCGPQALSSILSYYGIHVNQEKISGVLKACPTCYMQTEVIDPYVRNFGLRAQRFKKGAISHVKALVRAGYPVLVLQYLKTNSDVPHFRIVTGFDDRQKMFFLNDPYYAPNAAISYDGFQNLWSDLYSREFIVIYPEKQKARVGQALGVKL